MKAVVYDFPDEMIRWAADKIGIEAFRPDAKAIGMKTDGALTAVVVYDNFSPGSSFMSIASDGTGRWLTRAFLVHAFAYPFIQCMQRRVTSIISRHNAASIRFCAHCGFQHEGTLRRDGQHGEDTLVYGLLREECRFLPTGNVARRRV